MAFWEVEFPRAAKFGLYGGSAFNTTINNSYSGFEQRNKNWQASLAHWALTFQTRNIADWNTIHTFFLGVSGAADAFRLHWPLDYIATGATCFPATGDGGNKHFQLQKQYGPLNGRTYTRVIKKPVTSGVADWKGVALTNTVKMYLNGVLQVSGFTVDFTTGIVTFTSAPGAGVAVTADFEFHYPVRFDTDDMGGGVSSGGRLVSANTGSRATIEESKITDPLVTWQDIPIIEVRLQ